MSERIPFNVEKWRSGKYDVEIRAGDKITSLHVHDANVKKPISFHYEGDTDIETCSLSGVFKSDGSESVLDLFLVPKDDAVTVSREDIKVALEWYNRLHSDRDITNEDVEAYEILKNIAETNK